MTTYNEANHPEIVRLYKKNGLTPPAGRGENTMAFHKCVVNVKVLQRRGKMSAALNAYAFCMHKLGPDNAINKSHRRVSGV